MKTIFLFPVVFFVFYCSESTSPPDNCGQDTTSHNFTWTIDTIGDYGSYLKDIAIISEDNIWAVGEIRIEGEQNIYNAVHWNGKEWTLERIPAVTSWGTISKGPMLAVYSFSSKDLWIFSQAGSYAHWNGHKWNSETIYETVGSIYKIWGNSPDNMYFVGSNGNLTHYDGQTWQKLESGTTIDLLDVWGSPDGSVIWACGYTDFKGTVLLKITDQKVEKVYDDLDHWDHIRTDSLSGVLTSVWANSTDSLFLITPAGLYKMHQNTFGDAKRLWFNMDYVPGFPRRLRGTAKNDLLMVGDFHMITHFNGRTFRYFEELRSRARWRSIDYKNNVAVAVGWNTITHKALITIGKK